MAQNPIGISKRERGISVLLEMRETTGRKRAAAPTFCMKDEITPTVEEMIGIMRFSLAPPTRNIHWATDVMAPVLSRPAPMIITAMIETTAFEEKPSNISRGSLRPSRPGTYESRPRITRIRIAATSTRTISDTNKKTVTANRLSTATISFVRPRASKPAPCFD